MIVSIFSICLNKCSNIYLVSLHFVQKHGGPGRSRVLLLNKAAAINALSHYRYKRQSTESKTWMFLQLVRSALCLDKKKRLLVHFGRKKIRRIIRMLVK